MTLYLDTSALVKIYIDEQGTTLMREVAKQADTLVTSRMTYVEIASAVTRRRREDRYSLAWERARMANIDANWPDYTPVDVTQSLIESAAGFVRIHGLRAYDALHLASALQLQADLRRPITFAAFDNSLNKAAKKEKLLVLS